MLPLSRYRSWRTYEEQLAQSAASGQTPVNKLDWVWRDTRNFPFSEDSQRQSFLHNLQRWHAGGLIDEGTHHRFAEVRPPYFGTTRELTDEVCPPSPRLWASLPPHPLGARGKEGARGTEPHPPGRAKPDWYGCQKILYSSVRVGP